MPGSCGTCPAGPEPARFIPSAVLGNVATGARWIADLAETCTPGRGWWCVAPHDGTPVRAVVLKPIRYSAGRDDEVEIGWWWHLGHPGHGHATEAAELLLAVGLAGGLERIIAVVDPADEASQAVRRRISMKSLDMTADAVDGVPSCSRPPAPCSGS